MPRRSGATIVRSWARSAARDAHMSPVSPCCGLTDICHPVGLNARSSSEVHTLRTGRARRGPCAHGPGRPQSACNAFHPDKPPVLPIEVGRLRRALMEFKCSENFTFNDCLFQMTHPHYNRRPSSRRRQAGAKGYAVRRRHPVSHGELIR
jgi:hypothetical protein